MVGIGLFAPLPLAIMIPFMAGQSFAMGEAFGKGFQFGKRKISSMSNEEFNALTGPEAFAQTTADITAMIPTMKNAMGQFHTLQTDIILQMIDYIAKLPAAVGPETITTLFTPISNPNALFAWSDVLAFFKVIFGSDAATIKFLEEQGFSAAAQPSLLGSKMLELQAIANLTTDTVSTTDPQGPTQEFTQQQLLEKYSTFVDYRANGGLLTSTEWEVARANLNPLDPIQEDIGDITDPNDNILTEFLESLIRDDFKTGGQRIRIYKGHTITWNTVAQITTSLTSFNTFTSYWQSNKWEQQSQAGFPSIIAVNQYINGIKADFGAVLVLTFRPIGTNTEWFYVIKTISRSN